MNQRIRELFKRAGGKTSARNLASNPVQVVETHELWDDRIEKFAELIVRECADHIDDLVTCDDDGNQMLDCDDVRTELLEHFGVEQ